MGFPTDIPIWGNGDCLPVPKRLPEYFTLQVSAGPIVGGQAGVIITRYQGVFVDLGVNVGTPGFAFEGGPGWINTADQQSCSQINNYVGGWGLSTGGAFGGGANGVWAQPWLPFNLNQPSGDQGAFGYEGLLGTPQAGGTLSYAWQIDPLGWLFGKS